MRERTRVTRKEARENLQQLNLACELARLIRHFFPDLIPLLREGVGKDNSRKKDTRSHGIRETCWV